MPPLACVCVCVCSVESDSWDPIDCSPPGSSGSWDSPGKNTGVGCHALLQRIVPTPWSNPGLLHGRQILNHSSYLGSPALYLNSNQWFPPTVFMGNSRELQRRCSAGKEKSFVSGYKASRSSSCSVLLFKLMIAPRLKTNTLKINIAPDWSAFSNQQR